MPMYLEYDKISGEIKRILTADSLPANVAYLAYQEIPEGLEINTSLHINEIVAQIMLLKNNKEVVSAQSVENNEIEIIEV